MTICNKCKAEVPDIKKHAAIECLEGFTQCRYCTQKVQRKNLQEHSAQFHDNAPNFQEQPVKKTSCRICSLQVPISQIKIHLKVECLEASTFCQQCGEQVIRKMMPEHFQKCQAQLTSITSLVAQHQNADDNKEQKLKKNLIEELGQSDTNNHNFIYNFQTQSQGEILKSEGENEKTPGENNQTDRRAEKVVEMMKRYPEFKDVNAVADLLTFHKWDLQKVIDHLEAKKEEQRKQAQIQQELEEFRRQIEALQVSQQVKEIQKKQELEELKNLIAQKEEQNMCKICLDKQINTICLPCRHMCMCEDCAKNNKTQCPMCRARINEVSKIFKS